MTATGTGASTEGLRAQGITVRFEGVQALQGVDLELSNRGILGLIGPNGAGKTTLVNTLTGFQPPAEGRVLVDGEDATGWTPHEFARAGVARTFQSGRFFARMTVEENVEVGAVGMGRSRRSVGRLVDECLELTKLGTKRGIEAASLSHAEERRLGIARALAAEPRFILLDEPAASLDTHESAELVKTISELPQQLGCGVLVIEHDMDVIMNVSHRVQVLNYGRTIAIGSPADVRRDAAVIEAYLGTGAEADGAAAG